MTTTSTQASFSIASILAIAAAILSFNVGAIAGLLLALVAFVCGTVGAILALGPGIRGGILSVTAVILSVAGVIAAIVKAVLWVF